MNDMSDSEDAGPTNRDEGVPADSFAVKVSVTPATMTELLRRFELDVGDRPYVEPTAEGRGLLYAFASREQIRELEAAGYSIDIGENASETGRQRMAEVSEGDRFEGGRIPPRGLGRKPGRREAGPGGEPENGGQPG